MFYSLIKYSLYMISCCSVTRFPTFQMPEVSSAYATLLCRYHETSLLSIYWLVSTDICQSWRAQNEFISQFVLNNCFHSIWFCPSISLVPYFCPSGLTTNSVNFIEALKCSIHVNANESVSFRSKQTMIRYRDNITITHYYPLGTCHVSMTVKRNTLIW